MSLRDALDLPDEPRSFSRGPAVAAVGAAVVLAGCVVGARTMALGGWKSSNVVVGVALILPATIAAWALCGPHRQRTLVTGVAAVLAALLVPVAAAGATPSVSRLSSIVDSIGLPGRVTREVRIGNGRCRDACSEIRRVAYTDGPAFAKVYSQTYNALRVRNFELKRYAYAPGAPARIDAKYKKILVSLELRSVSASRTRIAVVVLADGPAPSHSVG